MQLQTIGKDSQLVDVRRTRDNVRKRGNGSYKRHDPVPSTMADNDELHFVHDTDLEWMSLNYRKKRAAQLSPSKRRMILVMFQNDIQYFPSMEQIRDQLIKAQMKQIDIESRNWCEQINYKALK